MLAVTGMLMLWIAFLDGRDGERIGVVPQESVLALSAQSAAAVDAVSGSTLKQYIAPRTDDVAALFRVDLDGAATMVAVDPFTAEMITTFPRRSGWYDTMDNLHSDIMLGVTGDRMLEIAASLGMVLIATGLYMWWPRGTGWRAALIPTLKGGRSKWKSLHGTFGLWISAVLVFFLLSGLAWTGVWGGKLVQVWSTFPAAKWDNVPLSDDIHASMNHGAKEVPWALEQTPMPASDGTGVGVGIDAIDVLAREIGFDGRYQLNVPSGETGVWTISRDSMSNDDVNPTTDRTTHVDQYSGAVLADVRFADYALAGKAMAVGIALHMGTMGLWSVLANTIVCLIVILLCVTSLIMWWKRRPVTNGRLMAPPLPRDMPLWKGAVIVGLFTSLVFPLAGITILTVMLIDFILVSRVPVLKRVLS